MQQWKNEYEQARELAHYIWDRVDFILAEDSATHSKWWRIKSSTQHTMGWIDSMGQAYCGGAYPATWKQDISYSDMQTEKGTT